MFVVYFCSVQTLAPLNPVTVDQTTNKVTSQPEGQPHSESHSNEYEGIHYSPIDGIGYSLRSRI